MNRQNLNESNIRKLPAVSGIYRIHTQKLFPRLLGKTDIVYIGKGQNLRKRLLSFFGYGTRRATHRFDRLKQKGFKLAFSFLISKNPEALEKQEIKKYELRHLEIPPLNHRN